MLFDQNLSYRLIQQLADIYPDCQHVRNIDLKAAADSGIWRHARTHGFILVSKDTDFYQRSLVLGYPPKVIWVKLGNCSTQAVERILRTHLEPVRQFEADEQATFLALS